jgi:ketosteroid isomerase-like protein
MRAWIACLLLCFACGGGAASRSTTAGPVVSGDAAATLPAALEQWRQAYEVRSIDALEPLYSATDDLTLVVQGKVTTTWPSVRASILEFLTSNTTVKLKVQDVRIVSLGGDGAVVVAGVNRRYGDGIRSTSETGVLTLLFRQAPPVDSHAPGTWRIALEHYLFRSGAP